MAENYIKTELEPTYNNYNLSILTVNFQGFNALNVNSSEYIWKEEYRFTSQEVIYEPKNYSATGFLSVSTRKLVVLQAILNIIWIIIIIILFLLGVYFFEKDAR